MSGDVDWTAPGTHDGFGTFTPADEYLHGTGPEGDSLTETWFWGFNVPEASINAYVYAWMHPNLDVVSIGLILYRGITPHHLAAELFDFPAFLRMSTVIGDGSRIEVPNGLTVTVVDPLKQIRLEYADEARDTRFDVTLSAVADPVMRANGLHFEQIMKADGQLTLRGEDFTVDTYAVRDRSWGELRPEAHNPYGPYNWVTAAAEDGSWAFNVGSLDIPAMSVEQRHRDGWLWHEGRTTRLVAPDRVIERDPVTGRPTRFELDVTDVDGVSFRAVGEVVASVPWSGWHNMVAHLGLVRWETPWGVAWGETMDCQWQEQVRALRGDVDA